MRIALLLPLVASLVIASPAALASDAAPATLDARGGCPLEFFVELGSTTASPGGVVTLDFGVQNFGTTTVQHRLVMTAIGPVTYSRLISRGALPPGEGVITLVYVVVPSNAPLGVYDVSFDLYADGAPCGSESFTITVVPPTLPLSQVPERASGPLVMLDGSDPAPEIATGVPSEATANSDPFAAGVVAPSVTVSPNPFQGRATIRYEVAEASHVRLALHDALGREVAVLVDGVREAGWHSVDVAGASLPSGSYVVRLEAGASVATRRVTLVR